MLKKIQQVSIKGLLCRDGKVLVLKTLNEGTTPGAWELPGGRMDFGETIDQTFKREMREELGLKKARLGHLVNTWSFIFIENKVHHHVVLFDFVFYTDEANIVISADHAEYKWIGAGEVNKIKMRLGYKEAIKKFFKNKKQEQPCGNS